MACLITLDSEVLDDDLPTPIFQQPGTATCVYIFDLRIVLTSTLPKIGIQKYEIYFGNGKLPFHCLPSVTHHFHASVLVRLATMVQIVSLTQAATWLTMGYTTSLLVLQTYSL